MRWAIKFRRRTVAEPIVDAAWYSTRYQDVAESDMSPAKHYVLHGKKEGRFPNAIEEYKSLLSFTVDKAWYLSRYEDVKLARLDPAAHYLEHGIKEGRFPNEQAERYSFDSYNKFSPFIEVIFRTVLGREGTELEKHHWHEQLKIGFGYRDIIRTIENTDEAAFNKAALDSRLPTTKMPEAELRDFIKSIYLHLIGREATHEELSQWWNNYAGGADLTNIVSEIEGSDEARELASRSVGANSKYIVGREQFSDFMSSVYKCFYGRSISNNEVDVWYKHHITGLTQSKIFESIENSEEAKGYLKRRSGLQTPSETAWDDFRKYMEIIYNRFLGRIITDKEAAIWFANYRQGTSYHDILLSIESCQEAQDFRRSLFSEDITDSNFIHTAYEILRDRSAAPAEVAHFMKQFDDGSLDRNGLVLRLFSEEVKEQRKSAARGMHAASVVEARLFGSKENLTIKSWKIKSNIVNLLSEKRAILPKPNISFPYVSGNRCEISIITSLFKGGPYIESFMENITGQSIFRDCELIIIDANSPDNEGALIEKYVSAFPNIVYKRFTSRIGIYEAWNEAVKLSSGQFCTNANLDDCRSEISLEFQAGVLQNLNFVDVVYQDVLYTMEPNLDYHEAALYGFKTELPVISSYNLVEFNSPHNAPMWRRSLHDEIGLFDDKLKSAGDYDFWMRCKLANKVFFKLNDPHVSYYVNPDGLSTRPDTAGYAEANLIMRRYGRQLVSDLLSDKFEVFSHKIEARSGIGELVASDKDRFTLVQQHLRQIAARSRGKVN